MFHISTHSFNIKIAFKIKLWKKKNSIPQILVLKFSPIYSRKRKYMDFNVKSDQNLPPSKIMVHKTLDRIWASNSSKDWSRVQKTLCKNSSKNLHFRKNSARNAVFHFCEFQTNLKMVQSRLFLKIFLLG